MLSEAKRIELEQIIAPLASKFETKREHWIHGYDEGLSYCRECAEKKIAELLKEEPKADYCLDGGWGSEGDSFAMCEGCQCDLDNSLTDYGCEYELEHWESLKTIELNADLGHSFQEIISCQGWSGEHKDRIDKLARRILKAAKKKTKA